MASLCQADRKATVRKIINLYNHGEQKSTSDCKICQMSRADKLQHQKTTSIGSTSVSKEQKFAVVTGSSKLYNFNLKGKNAAWLNESQFLMTNRW